MTDAAAGAAGAEGAGSASGEGAGAQGAQNWMESAGFPEDLRANPTLKKFQDPVSLGKSYLELQGLVGGEKIALPKADAPPEEWARVWERLGRPEKPADYGLEQFKPPEGLPWDGTFAAQMAEKLHAHGLTKAQANGVVKDYADLLAAQYGASVQQQEQLAKQATEALRAKYGAAYDSRLHEAGKAVRALLGQKDGEPSVLDRVKLEDGRLLGDHPEVIELFMALGEKLREDGDLPGGAERRTTMTPAEAKRQLDALFGDERKMKILSDKSHPEHEALQAQRTALEQQVYPSP